MLNLKLQAKDYELTLFPPPHNLKSDPFPKQSQDQSLSKLNTLDLSLVIPLKKWVAKFLAVLTWVSPYLSIIAVVV